MKLTKKKEEEHLAVFIKLCPVLSMDEGEMGKHFSATQIFEKLSNVYIERAVRSGYADNSLYNPDQLMNLSPEQEKALGDVHDLLGSMPNAWKPEKINVNKNGLGDADAEQIKYIYYLSKSEVLPPRPSMAAKFDDNGMPTTEDEVWSDVMCAPVELFPYLFVSHSQLVNGEWSSFSNPVLWKKWENKEKDDKTDEAKKKHDEENKEKRARMSVLRGVAIRIPLLVYGPEINDEAGEEITIDNFASEEIVDQASWEEFMPKGFTKETFNILKDCFDRSIFTGAAKRIRQMVKEADNLNTEDRIAKIATIFSYFHNPDKETVLTPWRVVNMHMSDTVGGWCFWDEDFVAPYTEENQYGENVNAARFVDRGDVTKDVFTDYNSRILEINSKTGLYPLYMAYSLFKGAKEPNYRRVQLTGERGKSLNAEQYYHQAGDDLEIWKDVLQDNIFVVCRTKMAVSITKRTLAGFRKDIRMNIRCYEHDVPVTDLVSAGVLKAADEHVTKEGKTYFFNGHESLECDMINVLRAKPELFQNDIVRGNDFWHVYNSIPKKENENINNMKFKAIVGNPPYQAQTTNKGIQATPIYNCFIDVAKQIRPNYVSMISPSRWFAGGMGLDNFRNSMICDNKIERIVDFINAKDCFPTISISGGVSFFLWNNHYSGNCKFTSKSNFEVSTVKRPLDEFPVLVRYNKAVSVIHKVNTLNEQKLANEVSAISPFALSTTVRGKELPESNTIRLFTSKGIYYIDKTDVRKGKEWTHCFKVLVSQTGAEHAMEPSKDGTYRVLTSTMQELEPSDVCTHSYILVGKLSSRKEASNLLRYLKTKFVRFLALQCVSSIHISRSVFQFVPLQDFSRSWTDVELYAKYNLTEDEIEYIERLIKPMD